MQTKSANNFAEAILKKSQEYDNFAKNSAVSYASSDNQADKESFKKYNELSEIFSRLHGEFCQVAHAIEAEMRELK